MAEYKKIEDGKAELTCAIKGEKWEAATKKAFDKLVKKLDIKGFRKGQVPASLAKKYITDEACWYEAASELSNEAFKEALDEHHVDLIDQASMDLKEIGAEGVTIVFNCPVKPDVTLGDYKALKYELEEVTVTDEEVENEINKTLERKGDLELKEDGAVEDGDTVVIDFEGFKDEVAFDGGKADNYELVIGSHSFIPGFEEQVIGMKSEETKDINVTFPEDYHVEELKGAPVVFKVTVHEIKKKVLPTLDDEFVKELKIENVETVDAYKEHVKESILTGKKTEAERKADEKLLKALCDEATINIPTVMIEKETEAMLNDQAARLQYQGIPFDQYLKIIGQTREDIKKQLEESATARIKTTLCLEEVAKLENLEASDEDIEKYYDDMAKGYGMDVAEVKKYVPKENIIDDVKLQKAVDFLKK
mgnify:FL=1